MYCILAGNVRQRLAAFEAKIDHSPATNPVGARAPTQIPAKTAPAPTKSAPPANKHYMQPTRTSESFFNGREYQKKIR